MTETELLQQIRLAAGQREDTRLFRNNCGAFIDYTGRRVTFGLHPGSGDLIGPRTIIIEPRHVGRKLAIFSSIEVKTDKGRLTAEQQAWLDAMLRRGALAGVARSVADALSIIDGNL